MKSTAVYIKTDANSSQENIYCLLDSSLRPQLQKLQEEKKNITIGYYNVLVNSLYCPIKAKWIISSIK